jgi:hypothetical protein
MFAGSGQRAAWGAMAEVCRSPMRQQPSSSSRASLLKPGHERTLIAAPCWVATGDAITHHTTLLALQRDIIAWFDVGMIKVPSASSTPHS